MLLAWLMGTSLPAVPAGVDIRTWPTELLIVDAAGDYINPPDTAAQAELRRRTGTAEEILAEMERISLTGQVSTAHQYYMGAFTQFAVPDANQLERAFSLVKQAYHKEKSAGGIGRLQPVDQLFFNGAPLVLEAYAQPEAEAMLLDLIPNTQIRSVELILGKIALRPTTERLRALKKRLEALQQRHPEYPPDSPPYACLVNAIAKAERNLGGAPAARIDGRHDPSVPLAAPPRTVINTTAEPAHSFWRQPFVWVAAVLLLSAGCLWVARRRDARGE